MAQTFDIRFAAGENTFGWRGGGQLRVDTQGLSFALKRGLASLLARRRSQRIPAEKIIEVYREGDALRVEFATADNPRAVLPFWARNREAAAEIVRLLPTPRTFEVEHGPTEARGQQRPVSWAGQVAIVIVLAAAAWILDRVRATEDSPVGPTTVASREETAAATPAVSTTAAAPAAAPETAPGWTQENELTPEQARRAAIVYGTPVPDSGSESPGVAAPRMGAPPVARDIAAPEVAPETEAEAFVPMEVPEIQPRPDQMMVAIPQTSLAYATARDMLRAFEIEFDKLTEDYRRERLRFGADPSESRTFANRLDALEMRWRSLSDRILGNRKYDDPALVTMRGTLLTVVISQRVFLTGYAAGLRAGDGARIDRAFNELKNAEQAMARARQYVN